MKPARAIIALAVFFWMSCDFAAVPWIAWHNRHANKIEQYDLLI